jgi:outer membrane protein TolC
MNRLRIPGLTVAALLVAAFVHAQNVQVPVASVLAPREYQPTKATKPAVTLAEAVDLTIRHSVAISLATQRLDQASGQQRQARGLFDPLISVGPGYTMTWQALTPAQVAWEQQKRKNIRDVARQFTQYTYQLDQQNQKPAALPPRCPSNIIIGSSTQFVDRLDPLEIAMLGTSQNLITINAFQGIDLSGICSKPLDPTLSAQALSELLGGVTKIDQSGGYGLNGVLQSVSQMPRESSLMQEQITNAVATRGWLALSRLSELPVSVVSDPSNYQSVFGVPKDTLQGGTQLMASYLKPFRNGWSVSGDLQLQSQETDYHNKPLDPGFGGFDTPAMFRSAVSGTLNVPLARGGGRMSVESPLRAATYLVVAGRHDVRYNVAEEVFRTTLAYVNLAAAQENVRLIEESFARQQKLVELAKAQVDLGDLAAAEINRARAREARVASGVNQARAALLTARLSLADAMSVDVEEIGNAPLAAEGLPSTPVTLPGIDELIGRGLALRQDLQMYDQRRASSAELLTGARANLRHQFDFSMNFGVADIYTSPFFKFLPDEAGPIFTQLQPDRNVPVPGLSAVRFTSGTGYYRALTGRWTPFLTANFTMQLPFGNNSARGRVAQAMATLSGNQIQVSDTQRMIRENIVNVGKALNNAAEAMARWQIAVTNDEQTLQAALDRFANRELTLMDTLITEESVTTDRLQLVVQRQVYFSTLARLRYETGEIVKAESDGKGSEVLIFQPTGFVVK